jgi:hypothetical protein
MANVTCGGLAPMACECCAGVHTTLMEATSCSNGQLDAFCNMTQVKSLLAFKASGGAANDKPLASWSGTDPCGGAWAGVTCSGPNVTRLALHNISHCAAVAGNVNALSSISKLSYLNLKGTAATGWPLTITNGCCIFVDAAHPYCFGKAFHRTNATQAACVAFVQTTALMAFKASGGAANDKALASWSGTDPCGGAWAGVKCSGGAAPTVTRLAGFGYHTKVAGDV